ncbi:hypothetical protein [Micromonospora sp. NPDC048063]|uniref:hypothetical protein n=1 Tax=Micromonospora sp. NPDC048063 TaxID=3364256 RepID=UPI0037224496
MKTTPRLCPEWDPDPDVPADHRDRETCRNCHRVGTPTDAGHTPPTAPARKPMPAALAAAAQDRDAAILGERDREETR